MDKISFGYTINEGKNLLFHVSDTGVGIPTKEQKIVFDRFRQIDDSSTKNTGGTGLGLAVAKGLVNLMGGNIWLESEAGKGSVFYFTIPLTVINEDARKKKSKKKDSIDLSGKTILIVEDNDTNFELLTYVLDDTKAEILHAKTGRDAIDIALKDNAIDLILMDIKLPGIDGYEATKQIKAKKDIPIIAQTAFVFEKDKKRMYNAGCDGYITKPISSKNLRETILRFI